MLLNRNNPNETRISSIAIRHVLLFGLPAIPPPDFPKKKNVYSLLEQIYRYGGRWSQELRRILELQCFEDGDLCYTQKASYLN